MKYLLETTYFVFILFACTYSTKIDYGEFLVNEQVDLKIRLFEPAKVLQNYKITPVTTHNVNDTCQRDFILYKEAVMERGLWALKMLDASSKTPTGILRGNIVDLGNYDECVQAKGSARGIEVNGRHCMYMIDPSPKNGYILPLYPSMSICLPSSCDEKDVVQIVSNSIDRTVNKSYDVKVAYATCSTGESISSVGEVNVFLFTLGIYIGLLVLSTFCDIYEDQLSLQMKNHVEKIQFLSRFSLWRNAKGILSTENREGDLPFVHGMRAISCASIVLVHSYFLRFHNANVNLLDMFAWLTSWHSIPFLVSIYSVDIFFVISGFLMTYRFFKKIEKSQNFNVFHYYLHRLNRLTMPMVIIVYFTSTIAPNLGSGAQFEGLMNIFAKGCRTKWWSVVLYLNNFVQKDNFCLTHLWYLAVEMQLFWLSPVILYPLHKRPRIGLTILAVFFFVSVIASSAIVKVNKYPALSLSRQPDLVQIARSIQDVYMMPYTRGSTWLLGILLGFIVTHKQHKPNRKILYIGWILTFTAFTFFIYGLKVLTNKNYEYDTTFETIYAGFGRPAWAFVICWIIYVCMFECTEIISRALSAKFFLPLSRISYCTYLVHMVILVLQAGSEKLPRFFNDYFVLHSYVSDLILSFFVAFIYSLLFEIPALILDDTLFNKRRHAILHKIKRK